MVRLYRAAPLSSDARLVECDLPQSNAYRYISWDVNGDVETKLFGACWWRRHGQAVWVCKSQGRRQRQTTRERQEEDTVENNVQSPRKRRPELFLRARILRVGSSDPDPHEDEDNDSEGDGRPGHIAESRNDDDRILVQYPAGSTYRVRRDMLVPILATSNESNLVLAYLETNDYRRACVTHTGIDEHFLEIGCAQGVTCHRVQQTGSSGSSSNSNNTTATRTVVGLDKSESPIATARERYPNCQFHTVDILSSSNFTTFTNLLAAPPDVVALDVNGNRELEAVLQCLEVVLRQWQPRLVLVKSRALFHCIKAKTNNNDDK